MAECLTLWFPQWQGSGTGTDLYDGAREIRDALLPKGSYDEVEVSLDTDLTAAHGIWAYDAVFRQLENAAGIIAHRKPGKICTIGGGCGIDVAPVSYLNQYYGGDLSVVWFDAHGDLNTPESSPTGYFHGMPLRILLGEGEKHLVGQCYSRLVPEQLVLAGVRDLDPPEAEYISRHNIRALDVDLEPLMDMVKEMGSGNLYMHVDLDVLDPVRFPSVLYPVENGLSMEDLMETLAALKDGFNVVGFSLTEYTPGRGAHVGQLKELIEYGYGL